MKRLIEFLSKKIIVIPLILLGFTPLIWFYGREGFLINGVDTNFPLDPLIWFLRRFYVWNNIVNGGLDFSSSTAGLFFHLIQVIPYLLGFNLQLVQIISLIFWFLLIVFSSFIFARTIFPNKRLIQLLFVVFYSFNIYFLNTWENVKVANLSLMAAIPLGTTILTLLWVNLISLKKALFFAAVTGIILSGAGINPAYFLTFYLIVFIYSLGIILADFNKDRVLKIMTDTLLVSVIILFVNAFWILPTFFYVIKGISPRSSIDQIGFVNWVDSLSENTSLANVMRMQGAWDWYAKDDIARLPLYIPYATNYFHHPLFIEFSFAIVVLVLGAFLIKRKNYLYVGFGLMMVLGIFLGAGTHPPTGKIYRLFLNHLPFFSLFRSPWYIFAPLVVFSFAALIALFFFSLDKKFAINKLGKIIIFSILIILMVSNLLYCYPLVSGKIFRPERKDSFYVKFPDYIFAAKKWLSNEKSYRIIGYPGDEIEEFRWGYRGIESILGLLADKEVLFTPLNAPDSKIALLIKNFYLDLQKSQIEAVLNTVGKLNLSLLFEKKDQNSLSLPLPKMITSQPHVDFGQWIFYSFPTDTLLPKIYPASNILFGYPMKILGPAMLSVAGKQEILADPKDAVVNLIPKIEEYVGQVIVAENSQKNDFEKFLFAPSQLSNRLAEKDPTAVNFSFIIPKAGFYQPVLERYKLEDYGFDLTKNIEAELDGQKTTLGIQRISDSYLYLAPFNLNQGQHSIRFVLKNKNLIENGNFEKEPNFEKEGEGKFEIKEEGVNHYLAITNKNNQDASVNFSLPQFDLLTSYLIVVKYKQVYGNNASILLKQSSDRTIVKVNTERMPNYPDWTTFAFYFEPVKTMSELKIALVAPFTKDPLGTTIFYDNLAVYRVFTNNLFLLQRGEAQFAQPDIFFQKINPTQYEGEVKKGEYPHLIVFSENYSPEWHFFAYDKNGNKITSQPLHFSVNLYANGWYLEKMPPFYRFKIIYQPQRLFWLGLGISGLTLLLSIIISVIKKK